MKVKVSWGRGMEGVLAQLNEVKYFSFSLLHFMGQDNILYISLGFEVCSLQKLQVMLIFSKPAAFQQMPFRVVTRT